MSARANCPYCRRATRFVAFTDGTEEVCECRCEYLEFRDEKWDERYCREWCRIRGMDYEALLAACAFEGYGDDLLRMSGYFNGDLEPEWVRDIEREYRRVLKRRASAAKSKVREARSTGVAVDTCVACGGDRTELDAVFVANEAIRVRRICNACALAWAYHDPAAHPTLFVRVG
jgi:hypothetical protein